MPIDALAAAGAAAGGGEVTSPVLSLNRPLAPAPALAPALAKALVGPSVSWRTADDTRVGSCMRTGKRSPE